jgi:hypothetical protein
LEIGATVPPEWLLRGLVLQALYGIRSERLLVRAGRDVEVAVEARVN